MNADLPYRGFGAQEIPRDRASQDQRRSVSLSLPATAVTVVLHENHPKAPALMAKGKPGLLPEKMKNLATVSEKHPTRLPLFSK